MAAMKAAVVATFIPLSSKVFIGLVVTDGLIR
jgi:hypothetical protein